MKKMWISPITEIQEFVANEYVAACQNTSTNPGINGAGTMTVTCEHGTAVLTLSNAYKDGDVRAHANGGQIYFHVEDSEGNAKTPVFMGPIGPSSAQGSYTGAYGKGEGQHGDGCFVYQEQGQLESSPHHHLTYWSISRS